MTRKLLLALSLVSALALAFVASAPTTEAAPGPNCVYYSDAGKTNAVGWFGKDCCNNIVARGVKTSFYTCSTACLICYPPPR